MDEAEVFLKQNAYLTPHKEPGYFLGAMYVSYAMTLAESVAIYILVHNFTTSLELILTIIFAVVVLMSFINFRYSRMIWMYMFTRRENPQG